MGRIRLTGATSGYTELRAANAAGNNTITLPTTTGGEVIVSDSSGNVNIDSGTFYIDASNNRVGIGTTSPQETLHLSGTGWVRTQYGSTISSTAYNAYLGIQGNNYGAMAAGDMSVLTGTSGQNIVLMADSATGTIRFASGGNTERARVDSSGRLLVGTSSAFGTSSRNSFYSLTQIRGNTSGSDSDGRLSLGTSTASASVTSGKELGRIVFTDGDGGDYAYVQGFADGTAGSGDYPGRIVLATTADGASSPTERMRIDNAGNIGIGRSPNNTSGQIVDIKGNDARIRVNDNKSDTGEVGIEFGLSGGGGGNNTAKVAVMAKAAGVSNGRANLVFYVDTADDGNPWSSADEAMRINLSRNLLIGYTSDNGSSYKLQVNSQIFATSSTIATSDGRYKENVTTLGGCVDLVKALRPVSFTWKPQQDVTLIDDEGNEVLAREGHNFPDGTQVGFIAQEVQEVLAEKPWLTSVIKQNVRPAVTDKAGNELAPEEEFLGIAEGNLIAVLTSALQEAIGRIETLEAEVAALRAE